MPSQTSQRIMQQARPRGVRRLTIAGTAAVALGLLAVFGGAATAANAAGTIAVHDGDFSSTNVSDPASRNGATKWDTPTGALVAPQPAAGSHWVLDTEDKAVGATSVTADGLVLSVIGQPDKPLTADWQKVRYQYYLGTGGYPQFPASTTLSELLAQPISWDTTLLSGAATAGPVFQVQLQKQLDDGTYARVTVQSIWHPGSGHQDLLAGGWFANTDIYSDGYPTGSANGYTVAGSSGAKVNIAASGPGVSAAQLATNFGDFQVVSFGPNLGRDNTYSYAIQNLEVLGQTFTFSPTPTAPPTPPVTPTQPATPPASIPDQAPTSGPVIPSDAVTTQPPAAGSDQTQTFTIDLGPSQANQWVYVVFYSSPTPAGWYLADGSGVITLSAPSTLPTGTHTIAVFDPSGALVGYVSGVSVIQPAVLASTGANATPYLVGGGFALALGLGLLTVSRRRRSRLR